MDVEPDSVRLPVQSPEATHDEAFCEFQAMVIVPAIAMTPEEVTSITEGSGGAADTDTLTDALVEPPGPLQLREKVVDADRLTMCCAPDTPFVPDQPPVALHSPTFFDVQVRVIESPCLTETESALKATEGAGGLPEPPELPLSPPLPPPPQEASRSRNSVATRLRDKGDVCLGRSRQNALLNRSAWNNISSPPTFEIILVCYRFLGLSSV
jgi:hypothetical protein